MLNRTRLAWLLVALLGLLGYLAASRPGGGSRALSSPAPGHSRTEVEHSPLESTDRSPIPDESAVVPVPAWGEVVAKVVAPDGAPREGLLVECVAPGESVAELRRTSSSGEVHFGELRPGRAHLRVAGYSDHAAIEVTAGATESVRFVVGAGTKVRARVVSPEGEPVQGAEVGFLDSPYSLETFVPLGRSNPSGDCVLDGFRPGGWLIATHGEFGPSNYVEVPEGGAEVTVLLELTRADYRITGRVVDAQHRPLAGATIWAGEKESHIFRRTGSSPSPGLPSGVTVTGADGGFQVAGALRDGQAAVWVRRRGHATRRVVLGEPRDGVQLFVEIVLEQESRVSGAVATPGGEPVPALVAFRSHSLVPAGNMNLGPHWAEPKFRCKDDGTFFLSGLPSGPGELVVSSSVGVLRETRTIHSNNVWNITLDGSANGATTEAPLVVGGRVMFPGQEEAPGVEVALTSVGSASVSTTGTTDEEGKFQLQLPTGEEALLSVRMPADLWGQILHQEVVSGGTSHVVRLGVGPAGTIVGQMPGVPDGKVAAIHLFRANRSQRTSVVVDGSSLGPLGVPSGRWWLEVELEGKTCFADEIEVHPGEATDLGPIGQPMPSSKITVHSKQPGASVMLVRAGGSVVGEYATGKDTALIEGIPAGNYSVVLDGREGLAARNLTVYPGQDSSVSFHRDEEGVLTVTGLNSHLPNRLEATEKRSGHVFDTGWTLGASATVFLPPGEYEIDLFSGTVHLGTHSAELTRAGTVILSL